MDVFEREAERLRTLDEAQPGERAFRIPGDAARFTVGYGQQLAALVVCLTPYSGTYIDYPNECRKH
jgi:hypothetical protein